MLFTNHQKYYKENWKRDRKFLPTRIMSLLTRSSRRCDHLHYLICQQLWEKEMADICWTHSCYSCFFSFNDCKVSLYWCARNHVYISPFSWRVYNAYKYTSFKRVVDQETFTNCILNAHCISNFCFFSLSYVFVLWFSCFFKDMHICVLSLVISRVNVIYLKT